jgi:hypothetical protein
MCLFLCVASDNVACRGRSSSILQQLLQKSLAATFMVAEEIEDAEFADQRILNHLASSGGTQKTGQNPKFLRVDP